MKFASCLVKNDLTVVLTYSSTVFVVVLSHFLNLYTPFSQNQDILFINRTGITQLVFYWKNRRLMYHMFVKWVYILCGGNTMNGKVGKFTNSPVRSSKYIIKSTRQVLMELY